MGLLSKVLFYVGYIGFGGLGKVFGGLTILDLASVQNIHMNLNSLNYYHWKIGMWMKQDDKWSDLLKEKMGVRNTDKGTYLVLILLNFV